MIYKNSGRVISKNKITENMSNLGLSGGFSYSGFPTQTFKPESEITGLGRWSKIIADLAPPPQGWHMTMVYSFSHLILSTNKNCFCFVLSLKKKKSFFMRDNPRHVMLLNSTQHLPWRFLFNTIWFKFGKDTRLSIITLLTNLKCRVHYLRNGLAWVDHKLES